MQTVDGKGIAMKEKILATGLLAAVLAVCLCACGQQGSSSGASSSAAAPAQAAAAEYKTMADVYAVEKSGFMSTYDEKVFKCAFDADGKWIAVEAELPEGAFEKLQDVFAAEPGKVEELLSPAAITKVEVYEAPVQDELKAYEGKTGAELAAEGFDFRALAVNGEETDCMATKAPFDYLITFEGAVEDENTDDLSAAVGDLKATNISVQALSWSVLGIA